MQNVPVFGYPTPPASLDYEQQQLRRPARHPPTPSSLCSRYVPASPEERLGMFLTNTRLQLIDILGNGAYGVVYLAVDVNTGMRYAVKTLSRFKADGTPLDQRQLDFQTREIHLHYLATGHENIVSLYKIIDDPDCIYVVLEYCPEGDLFLNITERGQYVGKDALAKKAFLQIVDAVEHCHSRGIFHRDLKPENILVKDNGATMKLADFGLATSSDKSEDYGCGSTFYMSPECLDPSARSPFYLCAPNDVWSLGIILVNLACGRNPWKSASFEDSSYRAFTRDPGYLKTILPLSDELAGILGRIFTRDPDERITLSELKARIHRCNTFGPGPSRQKPHVEDTPPSGVSSAPDPVEYVDEEAVEECDCDSDASSMFPDSSDSGSESSRSSDSGSLTSAGSTISDLDDTDFKDAQPPVVSRQPAVFEESSIIPYHQDFATHAGYPHGPAPVPSEQVVQSIAPRHCQAQNPSKGGFNFLPLSLFDTVFRLAPQAPVHPTPGVQLQMPILPIFAALHGCY